MSKEDCYHFFPVPSPRKGHPHPIAVCRHCGEAREHSNVPIERTGYGHPATNKIRRDADSVLKNL